MADENQERALQEPTDEELLAELSQLLSESSTDLPEPEVDSFPEETPQRKQDDPWLIGLLATACCLCVGIIALLIYWLEVFLK